MQLNFRPLMLLCSATLLFSACQKEESLEKGLRSTEFDLTEVNGSGISGKVLFTENKDSSFNVLVTLNTSLLDSLHAVRIYNGRIDSAGPVAIPLTSILGNGVAAICRNPGYPGSFIARWISDSHDLRRNIIFQGICRRSSQRNQNG